jgi:hypothetical protein
MYSGFQVAAARQHKRLTLYLERMDLFKKAGALLHKKSGRISSFSSYRVLLFLLLALLGWQKSLSMSSWTTSYESTAFGHD